MTPRPSIGIFLSRPDRSAHMARKLRSRGFEVTNYSAEGYEREPYVQVPRSARPALEHLLLRTNHDVYFTGICFLPSTALYLNRLLRRKPYVFNLTGLLSGSLGDRSGDRRFSRFFERFYPFLLDRTFAGAASIVSNSRYLEKDVALTHPRYRERLTTIYNGIEIDRYGSGRPTALPGVEPGDFVLLFVTAFNFGNKSRGLELVLDAFERILAERPRVKLVVAAKSTNPRYQRWAEEHLRSKPWRSSVTLVYNASNVPDLLASADLFVYATPGDSNDSLPRALLEAHAAGLPAVTTDTTGCPEIVRDRETGFVVPYDAAAMAEKVLGLIDDETLRREFGAAARRHIASTFNWDRMADQYAALFRQILG